MSYNVSMGTITVGDTTYDVETHSTTYGQRYTLMLDDEDVFEGLEGKVENEQHLDENDNPREWCNVGTMCVSYRGYNLGDEDISQIDFSAPCQTCDADPINWVVGIHATAERLAVGSKDEAQAFLDALPDVLSGRYYIEPIMGEPGYVKWDGDPGHYQYDDGTMTCPDCGGSGLVELNPAVYFKQERGARVVLPLIVYEHSGITMRCGHVGDIAVDSQGWDTSFVGYIFDTPEQVKETMGDDVTDEKIEEALRGEVEIYASYLEGDVCWFGVEDDETNYSESCGGFVGCQDDCEAEMYSNLEDALIRRINEESERAYWLAREVVTV